MTRLVLVTAWALAASLCLGQEGAAPAIDEKAEAEFLQLFNAARKEAGLPALANDPRLREAARSHARLVEANEQISSQFPGEPALHQRYATLGILQDAAAENVFIGLDVRAIHAHSLAGGSTRTNVLSERFTAVGIGVLRRDDELFVVQDFARVLTEQSAEQVERDVVHSLNEARRLRKVMQLAHIPLRRLRDTACRLARENLDPALVPTDRVLADASPNEKRIAGVQSTSMVSQVFTFTTLNPTALPDVVLARRYDSTYSTVSVGACFQRTDSYPQGTYWVVLMIYRRQSFR